MNALAGEFFSQLHRAHLKPSGYTKVRHTFSRKMGIYTERVQFQGSAWNDQHSPWVFYINFGVEFHDLPPRQPSKDFPSTHCWTRIQAWGSHVPKQLSLIFPVSDEFTNDVASFIEQSSKHVASTIQEIRKAYELKNWPVFPAA